MIEFFSLSERNRFFSSQIQQATLEVLGESRFINGSHVEKFESEFADYLGVNHVVGVANGLDALTIALLALEIGEGDEVIVPGFTFIATWLAVSRVGAKIIPVDVSSESGNINLDGILANLSPRTKAVISVNLYGRPALTPKEVLAIQSIGVRVIEDAAQSHGAISDGRKSGSYSDISCFSFYPTKNLGALGDGGAASTNDEQLAYLMRAYANYGATKSKYDHSLQGLNSRLDSLQAAYLSLFLPHLDAWNAQRRLVATRYLEEIKNPRLEPLNRHIRAGDSVWHHFVLRAENRDEFIESANSQGIQISIHYPSIPLDNPAYLKLSESGRSELKNSRALAKQVFSLPIYPQLSSESQSRVIDFVNSF